MMVVTLEVLNSKSKMEVVNTNKGLISGLRYLIDTTASTLSLTMLFESAGVVPHVGDMIEIVDFKGMWAINNVTLTATNDEVLANLETLTLHLLDGWFICSVYLGRNLLEDLSTAYISAQVPQHKNKLLQTQMTLPYTLSAEIKMVCFIIL